MQNNLIIFKVASGAIDGIVNESQGNQEKVQPQTLDTEKESQGKEELDPYSYLDQYENLVNSEWDYERYGNLLEDGESFYGADGLGDSIAYGFELESPK